MGNTFKEMARVANLLAKEYAEGFIRLLVMYKSISASEAASRMDLHIKTAQDFLDGLTAAGFLKKEEVLEKKRPYNRYTLVNPQVKMETNLLDLYDASGQSKEILQKVREVKDAPVVFTPAGSNDKIATVTLLIGQGRKRTERKISLTHAQGLFLFHLPFPTDEPSTIADIMKKAELDQSFVPEILDVVELLKQHQIIAGL